ncbi:Peptidoglycan-binding protein, CsiV [Vibrio xiamenensis]|uniref:Peptidoglycan-binding protein, CsiV n=1 Tax=Vibrio xiamenensis TaxID=861298 RepID=A0A1G7WRF9_9VIBR|nr:peptidoglycan binding protein CsiV [Vibrio xiamenensis]SDG74503.1 Peptidoglycan-binding protein, CsiV [Vibrio xiamenensis]
MKKLIPLLLFFVALPSWAARQFDVEVIIFKRAVDPEQTAESWPNELPKIDMSNAGSLNDANYVANQGAQLLSPSQYQLNQQEQALKDHAGFQVLLHTAWRQGDGGRYASPVFHIRSGRDYSQQFNADGSLRGGEGSEVIDGVTEQSISGPLYELDGKFQVYVEHYLYADLNLDLKEPSVRNITLEQKDLDLSADNLDSTDDTVQIGMMEDVTPTVKKEEFLKSYRMEQKRRMRSGETHFLDHPLLGVIIQVRKVAE